MKATEDKTSVLKSNIILGGAQIIQMIVTILRAKIIAIALGSVGMGVNAILQSMLLTLNNISSFGIFQSGVREISVNSSDSKKQSRVVCVVLKLVLLCSILGFSVTALFSAFLSNISFGNSKEWLIFVLLGFGVSFYTLTHGEMTILQGLRCNMYLAKASILGAVLSLAVCVPCYYLIGTNGVVVAIVLSYFVFWIVYKRYRNKTIKENDLSFSQAIREGKPIVSLGVFLMIGTFMVSLFTYLTNVSIRIMGNISDVGFYQGAASLATQSIVVITAVLATDFFPRLSALIKDVDSKNRLINEQIKLVVLIITPIVALIICFSEWFVEILLSREFLVVAPLLQCMALGLMFRGLWILMSYVILSHGDRNTYIIYDALLGNGSCFLITIIAYKIGGLDFLGVAYAVSSIVVFLILLSVVLVKYNYKMHMTTLIYMLISAIFVGVIFVVRDMNRIESICFASISILLSCYLLIKEFGLLHIFKKQK